MFPNVNPKQLEKAMKKLGVKQEDIEASEVLIKTKDKDLVIRNPNVVKVNMMGQETFQITGDIEEQEKELFNEEDVKTVMEQTNCSKEEAIEALEKEKDLAAAILSLNQ
ncbi:MAG: nascent polypeptide-associated complex protein [Candidatus Nanoarchaeia archaeon]|jgi:nascent polypeptide-associated complex subunit alpha|nr:nascent polypeptide-associated complex protein [Candidatus Nanoarchaeia archaeon]|tara:strand:+ start:15240 stop:15566 length:327 start_codon:yes stop_codon:yes gene_type:complete